MFTKEYAESKARNLARDYNAYKRLGNKAACTDYRDALDHLLIVAYWEGITIRYETDNAGFITIG